MITPIFKDKIQLKDLGLVKDGNTNEYYLTATYIVEDKNMIREITIPKIKLPVVQDSLMVDIDTKSAKLFPDVSVAMGFGQLDVEYGKNGRWYDEIIIKEKIHEMTLDEIEKELGYRVKVVNKKEEKYIKTFELCRKCIFYHAHNKCCPSRCKTCKNASCTGCYCSKINDGEICQHFDEYKK